jgi:hypothetical protein
MKKIQQMAECAPDLEMNQLMFLKPDIVQNDQSFKEQPIKDLSYVSYGFDDEVNLTPKKTKGNW